MTPPKTPVSSSNGHKHPSHIHDADISPLTSTLHTPCDWTPLKASDRVKKALQMRLCLSADIYYRLQSLNDRFLCFVMLAPTLTSPFICRRHNHISGLHHKANKSSVLCPKAKNSFMGWFCLCATNDLFTRCFDSPFHRQHEHF